MATSKVGQLKPFMIEEKKEGPNNSISEVTANKWKGSIIANIKKEEKWVALISQTWEPKKITNRGLTGNDAAAKATQIDLMLEYVSQYAPNALYRDITKRATSLENVWLLIRNWAGLKTSGCKQQTYFRTKHSYDPNGDVSMTDFFFNLRNAKEDCLLLSRHNGGKIKFHGSYPVDDEELSPTLESDVVLDWLEAIGGKKLVEHVFRVFSKELESDTLADLRQSISDNLSNLQSESDQPADLNRAQVAENNFPMSKKNFPLNKRTQRQLTRRPTSSITVPRRSNTQRNPCKYCLAVKPSVAFTHTLQNCYELQQEKFPSARATAVTDIDQEYPNYEIDEEEHVPSSDEEYQESEVVVNSCSTTKDSTVVKINRVNITESPILACSAASNRTIYLLLDTGATASIMTQRMASILNIIVYKTSHKAVQVDGESQLPVLGEVHTVFYRGSIKLHFSGLVVSQLGVDILAGTNFHVENDVYSRMAKGTIHIGDHCTVQSAPPSLLTLDKLDNSAKQRLVKVPNSTTVFPGEDLSLHVPKDLCVDSFIMVEPNLQQVKPFFTPNIVQVHDGVVTVKNESNEPVKIKKNCQALSIYSTKVVSENSSFLPIDMKPLKDQTLSDKQLLNEVIIDGNLSKVQKKPFQETILQHRAVFDPSLPGYNHAFGPVYATFKFASKARPVPSKIRSPNYGSHQDLLFNQKCQILKQLGVLIDPLEHNIQPIMTHNSWVVKKPSAASKPWEQCSVKDTRLVVGLDPLNKFLADPPGKITKTESIYASLANWDFMGELDFSDFYFQIKFRMASDSDKQKLGYLCIRTAGGTMCFSSATMGLLGMDVFQDELTDRLLGDLVLAGNVVKLADNIYFGSNSLEGFHSVFKTILGRCETADLKLKPGKLKINIQQADILGLNWNKGKLSPSRHKLDPLAECQPPTTVSGLRSWLGSVRFNEVCLTGAKLAELSKPLDEQSPPVGLAKRRLHGLQSSCYLLNKSNKF